MQGSISNIIIPTPLSTKHPCLMFSDYFDYCVFKSVFILLVVLLQVLCIQQDFSGFEQLFSGN